MADFAEAFKQQHIQTQQQLSPQQPSPPQVQQTAAAVYLQEQFQAETDAATAALVGAGTVAVDADAMEAFESQQVAVEEDEAAAGPGQAQAGEGEVDPNAPDTWFMTDESLEWTDSKIASYNPKQKLFRCIDCECCGFLARVAEHWLGTHANLRVFQCPHCPYASAWARCVRMHLARQHNASEQNALWTENPVLGEVTKYLSRLRARVEAGPLVVVNEDELSDYLTVDSVVITSGGALAHTLTPTTSIPSTSRATPATPHRQHRANKNKGPRRVNKAIAVAAAVAAAQARGESTEQAAAAGTRGEVCDKCWRWCGGAARVCCRGTDGRPSGRAAKGRRTAWTESLACALCCCIYSACRRVPLSAALEMCVVLEAKSSAFS
ncbi:hypothetical protein ONE63_010425 [Megalurothrips usitatus]|uniref:C2H2-type domain-containing protein n=1 Tax=Megalurothrips usitatus TaxID=439358 RepID=A0AAV7XJQ4_9NEOP|nr:hypothetical protein ONE63_010425 [Megalurothrips usitatus]